MHRNSKNPQRLGQFRPQVERLEDRFAPGYALSGLTPWNAWSASLPLGDAGSLDSAAVATRQATLDVQEVAAVATRQTGDSAGTAAARLESTLKSAGDAAAFALAESQEEPGALNVTRVLPRGGGRLGAGGAVRTDIGFDVLGPCDDCRTAAAQDIGFTVTIADVSFSSLYMYSNGFVSSGNNTSVGQIGLDRPLSTWPGDPLIAPFFADVDTTNAGTMTYGQGTAEGDPAFAATWFLVGHYDGSTDPLNTFQIVFINRKEGVQLEFNYGQILWESGDFAPNLAPRVGYTTGGMSATALEAAGSGSFGTLVDGNPDTGLVNYDDAFGLGGSGINGRHIVQL